MNKGKLAFFAMAVALSVLVDGAAIAAPQHQVQAPFSLPNTGASSSYMYVIGALALLVLLVGLVLRFVLPRRIR